MTLDNEYRKALEIGRPANVKKLFPHSQALLVSGKVIDRGDEKLQKQKSGPSRNPF